MLSPHVIAHGWSLSLRQGPTLTLHFLCFLQVLVGWTALCSLRMPCLCCLCHLSFWCSGRFRGGSGPSLDRCFECLEPLGFVIDQGKVCPVFRHSRQWRSWYPWYVFSSGTWSDGLLVLLSKLYSSFGWTFQETIAPKSKVANSNCRFISEIRTPVPVVARPTRWFGLLCRTKSCPALSLSCLHRGRSSPLRWLSLSLSRKAPAALI